MVYDFIPFSVWNETVSVFDFQQIFKWHNVMCTWTSHVAHSKWNKRMTIAFRYTKFSYLKSITVDLVYYLKHFICCNVNVWWDNVPLCCRNESIEHTIDSILLKNVLWSYQPLVDTIYFNDWKRGEQFCVVVLRAKSSHPHIHQQGKKSRTWSRFSDWIRMP